MAQFIDICPCTHLFNVFDTLLLLSFLPSLAHGHAHFKALYVWILQLTRLTCVSAVSDKHFEILLLSADWTNDRQ